jgi:hypothetical protein
MPEAKDNRVSSVRITPDSHTVHQQLGALGDLAGTWKGCGFNLIARPDFHDKTDLYLQLNQTRETLTLTPIGSPIPNRGFGQDDITLYGLTYLQQITDAGHDGALHIEPGIWITQPGDMTFPPQPTPPPKQLVARMGNIPHGNSLLAQGVAEPFTGKPVLTIPNGAQYNGSLFPSFNSTPFAVPPFPTPPPPNPVIAFNAAGSSEKLTAPTIPAPPFPQYDVSIPDGPIAPGPLNPPFTLNTRTPFGTSPLESPLPSNINGVPMQDVVNDPILLLQKEIERLDEKGYKIEGTVINIATRTPITFLKNKNSGATAPGVPTVTVAVPQFAGGIENIPFLVGETVTAGAVQQQQENAETALVYATFWIEKVTNPHTGHHFMQLQYAQMVALDFPIFHLLHQTPSIYVNLAWPHISVATLRKSFS